MIDENKLYLYTDDVGIPYEDGERPRPRTPEDDDFDVRLFKELDLILTEEARAEIQEEIREKYMLANQAWIELEKDSKTSVLCPKCNTHPKLIMDGNRSKIKCECGYIYDAETYL